MPVTAAEALSVVQAVVGDDVLLVAHDGDTEPASGWRAFAPYPMPPGYPRGFWTFSAATPAGMLASSRVVVVEKSTGRVVADGPGGNEG